MDDKIIVAIIGVIGTIIVALITSLVKSKTASIHVEKERSEETPVVNPLLTAPIKQSPNEKRKRITNLTHREICDAIEAVPPFHQHKMEADFIGMTVSWKTTLFGISHLQDEVSVSANIPEGDGLLHCYARKDDCDGFILAEKGMPFNVAGEIKKISRHSVMLIDCKFTILPSGRTSHNTETTAELQERNRRIFTAMVDSIKSQNKYSVGDMARDYFRRLQPINPLGELIKCSNEIASEANLNWFCKEFEGLGYAPPLKDFKSVLADNFHWLPVLQEARHKPREIKTQAEFMDFLATEWSQKELWKEAMERKNSAPAVVTAQLIIHSADWWIEDSHLDVTKTVRSHLIDGKIEMPCEISVLGDPRPGLGKILTIDYSIGGKRTERTFKEHDIISQNDLK